MAPVLVTLAVGLAGGLAGHLANIPAGPLLGAVAAVGVYNLATDGRAHVPKWIAVGARILIGTVIGSLVTLPLLAEVGRHLPWAALFAAAIIAVGLVSGAVISRVSDLDLRTAMIGACPGGMPEMAALAQEVEAEVDVVLGIHLVRKLLALSVIGIAVVVA